MGKNKFGGSKHKRYARNRNQNSKTNIKHLNKEPGQEYAFVKKKLGSCRLSVSCFDKKDRLAIIRGKLRKRCWINISDIILISLRDFEDDKCDVIQKFSSDQVQVLLRHNKVSESFVKDGNPFKNYEYNENTESSEEEEEDIFNIKEDKEEDLEKLDITDIIDNI